METPTEFEVDIARQVWATKYRAAGSDGPEFDRGATARRVARALASVECEGAGAHAARFEALLADLRFVPGGRILAGAGTARRVTLFNCFVMGIIEDSLEGILDALKEGALTMQQGGGVGYDFSTLRPAGTVAAATGAVASGPVSFMRIWDATCATLLSTGARRGAMMATLRCDHPDVEAFVDAKREPGTLANFNLSVLASDDFMRAVDAGAPWPLVFPAAALGAGEGAVVERAWPGAREPVACRVVRIVPARALWRRIMRATWACAEPGVLFVDRINAWNNLRYRETIGATNPCGEVPLPPYGACNLGSLNLPAFVHAPFSPRAGLDEAALSAAARTAVRMLDDVVDLSRFPLERQAEQARGTRRLGLGVTGLADALLMLGLRYDAPAGREAAARWMRVVCHAAYDASVDLAREKGSFPFLDRDAYLEAPFVRALPAGIRDGIAADGIRNSHLTAIAPAGTISLYAGGVSNGIEPIFAPRHRRAVLGTDGVRREVAVEDHACRLWREHGGAGLPPACVVAWDVAPRDHLLMQAALQPFVDSAISKTVNVPVDLGFERFEGLYREAFALGLKGCTTFRPNPVTGEVLRPVADAAAHCCSVEREAD